jgi:SET domain-containing protein
MTAKFMMPKQLLEGSDCTQVRRVYFEKTDDFGYGVFATRDIKQHERIEESTYFLTGFMNSEKEGETVRRIPHFCWTMKCNCESCRELEEQDLQYIVTTGNTMLYNHSLDFNAIVSILREERIVRVYARRDIKKDEQIFANYGPHYNFWKQPPH